MGSGGCAGQVRDWDLTGWTVGAIHNAWSITPSSLSYHFVSGDFIAARGNETPTGFYKRVRRISYKEYDGQWQRHRFGRQQYGIGATMLFNAAYWVLGNLLPLKIGFVGCSMDFPNGDANTFYGSGKADPLRFGSNTLSMWFEHFDTFARVYGCSLVNFGSSTGLMPYPTAAFNED